MFIKTYYKLIRLETPHAHLEKGGGAACFERPSMLRLFYIFFMYFFKYFFINAAGGVIYKMGGICLRSVNSSRVVTLRGGSALAKTLAPAFGALFVVNTSLLTTH